MSKKVRGAKWFIKMLNEARDTPGFKDETIDILEGEIKALLSSFESKEGEIKGLKKENTKLRNELFKLIGPVPSDDQ